MVSLSRGCGANFILFNVPGYLPKEVMVPVAELRELTLIEVHF
jgi:hypothetical protein